MSYNSDREKLLDYIDGKLTDAETLHVEKQLANDADLRDELNSLYQLQNIANAWQDEKMPTWQRPNPLKFNHARKATQILPWFSLAMSCLAIVFVTFNIQVTIKEGAINIAFADTLRAEQVDEKMLTMLEDWSSKQQDKWDQQLNTVLLTQQVDNQNTLLKAIEYARAERNGELKQLINLISVSRSSDRVALMNLLNRQQPVSNESQSNYQGVQ